MCLRAFVINKLWHAVRIVYGVKKKTSNYIITGILLIVIPVFFIIGCTQVKSVIQNSFTAVAEVVNPLTPREKYIKELTTIPEIAEQWQQSYTNALADSLTVALPYAEKGYFRPNQSPAYSYEVTLQEGEVFIAEVVTDSISDKVFIDVLKQSGSGWDLLKRNDDTGHSVAVAAEGSGLYKVVLQPELALNSKFTLRLEKKPLYALFPVAGKTNKDIGSFWGVDRDGGKRRHEGIDIFAKRGTPVVAVTDGYISYTGERGLGGKQVWQRDGAFGANIYYAHLDSIKASQGMRVKTGDTLGFVGNTGNARTTPPHLHFGIYRGGAVNPLPFVYKTQSTDAEKMPYSFRSEKLLVKSAANLRMSPSTKSVKVGSVTEQQTVTLLGQHNDWLHISTTQGKRAFLHKSLISKSI